MPTKPPLKIILRTHGVNLAEVARRMGVDAATLTRWGQKGVPAERAVEIERLTGVPRHEMRPDLWAQSEAAE